MGNYINALENINFIINIGNLSIHVLNLNKVAENPHWYVPEHLHTSFEFHIIPSGKGIVEIDGKKFEVSGGEFFVTGPMIRHTQSSDSQCPMVEYCLECEIDVIDNGNNDYTYEEGVFLKEILSGKYPYAFKDTYKIAQTFEALIAEASNNQNRMFLMIRNLIERIILDLCKTICENKNILYAYPILEEPKDFNRVKRIIKYIDANYKNNITIDDAAKVLYLSPRQINWIMQKTFNQSFHDYLLMHRMHKAEKLLTNTTMSIEDIAYESGFTSHYYMYQVFKRQGKVPPGQYRKMK